MLLKQIIEVYDILDSAKASGEQIKKYLHSIDRMQILRCMSLKGQRARQTW